jgi:hypothetical protein
MDTEIKYNKRGRPKLLDVDESIKPSKRYFEAFKNKNKDKIQTKHNCSICGGSYDYFNKSHHIKSRKHKFAEITNKIYEINKAVINA